MTVRLKDIAKEANVSISTVSRILNQDPTRKANDQTIARVFEAAERLGYFSQKLASVRALGTKSSDQKVYSVACILMSEHESYVSPFFSVLMTGIQQEIISQGSRFPHNFFVTSIKDPGFIHFLESTSLDCAIMLGRTTEENIRYLEAKVPNLVYAGVNKVGLGIDEVVCDARTAVSVAVEYLIELGHTEIGFIGPTRRKYQVFNEHRYDGYLDALSGHDLAVNEAYIIDTILTAADGYENMRTLITSKTLPTAIVCGNDTVAMGVMKALDEYSIDVPGDISVIGFDNIDTASYLKPALTTIDIPKRELGRLAVKVLVDRLESGRSYPLHVELPFTLLKRASCRRQA